MCPSADRRTRRRDPARGLQRTSIHRHRRSQPLQDVDRLQVSAVRGALRVQGGRFPEGNRCGTARRSAPPRTTQPPPQPGACGKPTGAVQVRERHLRRCRRRRRSTTMRLQVTSRQTAEEQGAGIMAAVRHSLPGHHAADLAARSAAKPVAPRSEWGLESATMSAAPQTCSWTATRLHGG